MCHQTSPRLIVVIFEEFENEEERKRKKEVHDKEAALAINSARRADEIFGQKVFAQNIRLCGLYEDKISTTRERVRASCRARHPAMNNPRCSAMLKTR